MTSTQLEALIIDQSLGELSDEASALLDNWLNHFPDRLAEAGKVREAIGFTGDAVALRPLELEPPEFQELRVGTRKSSEIHPLLKAAAAIGLLLLAAGFGYRAGTGTMSPSTKEVTAIEAQGATSHSPWARYRWDREHRFALVVPSQPRSSSGR